MKAAEAIESRESEDAHCDFSGYAQDETERLISGLGTESRFPVMYIRDMLAETMKNDLGIIRDENRLRGGIEEELCTPMTAT